LLVVFAKNTLAVVATLHEKMDKLVVGNFQNFALRETRPKVMTSFTIEDRLSFSRCPPTIHFVTPHVILPTFIPPGSCDVSGE